MLVAAAITGALLVSMDQPHGEIAVLLAVLVTIAFAWLALTHVVTLRTVAGSLRRHYAAGVLGAVGLVMASALAGTRLMVVSRRDAEMVVVMLVFSLIVALRVASLLSGHAAAQITRLGERPGPAGGRPRADEPVPETGPRELADLAVAANAMARDLAASDRARRELVAAVSHDLRTPIAVARPAGRRRGRRRRHVAGGDRRLPGADARASRAPARAGRRPVRAGAHRRRRRGLGARAGRPSPSWSRRRPRRSGPAADERSVTLAERVETALPPVAASPERLQRVLFNLLENAVAHAPAGGSVTLTADRENGAVRFEIADTGSGIAIADAPRVFDRFYRGGDDASRPVGGAGLGLAIARAIVEAHGGRIWVANPGEPGARMAFTVPVHSPA